jgi:hypothetical protein
VSRAPSNVNVHEWRRLQNIRSRPHSRTCADLSLTVTDIVTCRIAGNASGSSSSPAVASQTILSTPSSVTPGASFGLTLTVADAYGYVAIGFVGRSTSPARTLAAHELLLHGGRGWVRKPRCRGFEGMQLITAAVQHACG